MHRGTLLRHAKKVRDMHLLLYSHFKTWNNALYNAVYITSNVVAQEFVVNFMLSFGGFSFFM